MIDPSGFLLELLTKKNLGAIVFDIFKRMNMILSDINWIQIIKIAMFIALAVGLTIVLLVANDKVFEYYNSKRIKKHHLTIRNNGNVPSIFLLRTVDLPKQLVIRFRVGDLPMIWMSRKEAPKAQPEEEITEAPEEAPAGRRSTETTLVPDLKDPFSNAVDAAGKAVTGARKTASNVGKTTGLFAGIINSVTSLFGVKSEGLQNAQGALKDVQQVSNQAIQSVNTKLGTADTLSNQVGSLIPKNVIPDAAKGIVSDVKKAGSAVSALQQSEAFPGSVGPELKENGTMNLSQPVGARDFVYDEEVWRSNLGKVDEEGGDLNYAMSKTLQPGESMRVDVDIMNTSRSSAPVSLMYKIEIQQIPQTKLQLAAPKEYISGIVIYPKISVMSRIIPYTVVVGLIVISIQLLAGYSHYIF